jgi:cold shock protein
MHVSELVGANACDLHRCADDKGTRGSVMASGKVKWFDNKKGFGFIAQDSGQDVLVHHTCILGDGFKTLREGEMVSFELIDSDKGPKALKVQRDH